MRRNRSAAAPSGPQGRPSALPQKVPHGGGGLPFGAVMATGAASQLTDLAGIGFWSMPLLWLTIAVAGLVTGSGLVRLVRRHGAPAPRAAHARFGQFTIPVGLAVIGVGLAQVSGSAAFVGAVVATALAWGATILLTVVVAIPAVAPRSGTSGSPQAPGILGINGVWFIAPAAYLAGAAGTAGLAHRLAGPAAGAVGRLAVVGCGIGVVTYVVAIVLTGARVRARGLAGAPRVAWWIVVGCGGLAADALGHVGGVAPSGPFGAGGVFGWAAVGCWVVATIVLLPVGAESLRYLLRLRRLSLGPPWPPAFSTAVYALGTAQVGVLFGQPWAAGLARVAAIETLVVWAVTGALRVGGLAVHLRPRRHLATP